MNIDTLDGFDSSQFDESTFLLNYGLGDTINQILCLESNIDSNYNVICPKRNLKLIEFVLDKFIVDKSKLERIISYDKPIHGWEKSISNIRWLRPHAFLNYSDNSYVYLLHTSPNKFFQYIDKRYVINFENYLKSFTNDKEQKVILFPERSDNRSFDDKFWQSIVDYFNESDIKVYHNVTAKKKDVYTNSLILNNVEEIDLNFDDLLKFTSNSQNVFLIGQRSGIFDVVKYTNSQKIIFYHQDEINFLKDTMLLKDSFAKNLYEYIGEENEIREIIQFK